MLDPSIIDHTAAVLPLEKQKLLHHVSVVYTKRIVLASVPAPETSLSVTHCCPNHEVPGAVQSFSLSCLLPLCIATHNLAAQSIPD